MVASNIDLVFNCTSLIWTSVLLTILGFFLKIFKEIKNPNTQLVDYGKYEGGWPFLWGWTFGILWMGTMTVIMAVDIHDAITNIDSSPYIFVTSSLYQLFLLAWLCFLYVKQTKNYILCYGSAIMSLFSGIAFIALVFWSLHLDERPWYHWLSLLLILPPIFAWIATRDAVTFRLNNEDPPLSSSGRNPVLRPPSK